jgi:magnesium transporter
LRLFRRQMPRHTEIIFLINRSDHFSEALPIAKLYLLPEYLPLADVSFNFFSIISATKEG